MIEPYYEGDRITIYHGDCLAIEPEGDPAVLVFDPPYGISHSSRCEGAAPWRNQRSIANDESVAVREAILERWAGLPALVFGTWKVPPPPNTRAVIIWDKGDAGSGDLSIPWKPSHEQIYVIGEGFEGHRGPGVLRHVMHTHYSHGRLHPHEKPVSLMIDLLKKCPTGLILDPCMGSGPTLRAAKDLGREAVGIELEGRHCESAAGRLGQAVLDMGGA